MDIIYKIKNPMIDCARRREGRHGILTRILKLTEKEALGMTRNSSENKIKTDPTEMECDGPTVSNGRLYF
jgi:hypothetical protein